MFFVIHTSFFAYEIRICGYLHLFTVIIRSWQSYCIDGILGYRALQNMIQLYFVNTNWDYLQYDFPWLGAIANCGKRFSTRSQFFTESYNQENQKAN